MLFNRFKDNFRSLFLTIFAYTACFSSFATSQNQQPSKQFYEFCHKVMQLNPLSKTSPTQAIINQTVLGRNLMVVEDSDNYYVIVTGIAPRYHSGLKIQIQNTLNQSVDLHVTVLVNPHLPHFHHQLPCLRFRPDRPKAPKAHL